MSEFGSADQLSAAGTAAGIEPTGQTWEDPNEVGHYKHPAELRSPQKIPTEFHGDMAVYYYEERLKELRIFN